MTRFLKECAAIFGAGMSAAVVAGLAGAGFYVALGISFAVELALIVYFEWRRGP